jgi:hypothetical protein
VLSTAPIERVTIFDVLLAHNGILNVNQITESLRVSEPTARKTMLELDILGLVNRQKTDLVGSDGLVRDSLVITLKEEFNWFLTDEFKTLREGFKTERHQEEEEEEGGGQEQEAMKEKHPPPRAPNNSDRVEESNSRLSSVVHVREPYDIYIGREVHRNGYNFEASKWKNPYIERKDGTRDEVIEKYRQYIKTRSDLLASLPELKGKRLGCWCKPEPCHGDVLIELLEESTSQSKNDALRGGNFFHRLSRRT